MQSLSITVAFRITGTSDQISLAVRGMTEAMEKSGAEIIPVQNEAPSPAERPYRKDGVWAISYLRRKRDLYVHNAYDFLLTEEETGTMPPVPPKEDVDAMHKSHAFRYEEQSRAQRCIKAIKDTYGPYYAKVEIEHMQVPLSNMFVLPLPAYDRLPAKDDMDLKCFLGSGLAIGAGKRSDLNTLGIFTAAELIALSRHELELLLKATTNFGQASLSRLVAHCAGKGLPLRDE